MYVYVYMQNTLHQTQWKLTPAVVYGGCPYMESQVQVWPPTERVQCFGVVSSN